MKKYPRTLLLTNTAAPYRLPLFDALGEQMELIVYSCQSSPPDRRWRPDLESEHVRFVQLSHRTRQLFGMGPAWIWNSGLRARLREEQFDVYISGENVLAAPSVLVVQSAARREGKPFILWSGAIDTPYASGNWLSNLYRRWLYRRTDAFVAYGKRAKAFLVKRGALPDRISTGTQVIAPGWIWQVPGDKRGLDLEGQTVVLYVGYLVPRKGVADLIHAYQRVHRSNTTLVIVGDGPKKAELKAIAKSDADIRFTGYLESEAKWRYYASADLFVLPTYHDPWPQVINEAMYFGLPIITTDRDGSAHEVVRDGDNGLIIPADDVSALAEALEHLLADEPLRRQMGERSRAIIADYTLEAACSAFLQAISHALEEHDPTNQ